MKTNIVGEFDILPMSKLGHKITGVTLTIGTRKHPTPQKPKNFLLLILPTGKRVYISSLYPNPQNKAENPLQGYYFDYQGIKYTLTQDFTTGVTIISPLSGTPQDSVFPINNTELGVKITPFSPEGTTPQKPPFPQSTPFDNPQKPTQNDTN